MADEAEDSARWTRVFSSIITSRVKDALDAGVTPQHAIVTLITNAASLHVVMADAEDDDAFVEIAKLAVTASRESKDFPGVSLAGIYDGRTH